MSTCSPPRRLRNMDPSLEEAARSQAIGPVRTAVQPHLPADRTRHHPISQHAAVLHRVLAIFGIPACWRARQHLAFVLTNLHFQADHWSPPLSASRGGRDHPDGGDRRARSVCSGACSRAAASRPLPAKLPAARVGTRLPPPRDLCWLTLAWPFSSSSLSSCAHPRVDRGRVPRF